MIAQNAERLRSFFREEDILCRVGGDEFLVLCKNIREEAVIRIRDYGPGIPEEELPHVKYKFYKGSSKARGSGIGLAVCERSSPGTRGGWTSETPREAAVW